MTNGDNDNEGRDVRPDPTPGERIGLFTSLHPAWSVLGWLALVALAVVAWCVTK